MLVFLLLLILAVLVLVVALVETQQVSWSDKMRRLNPGVAHLGEWQAPDYVRQRVRSDYLEALAWLSASLTEPGYDRLAQAGHFLADEQLQAYSVFCARYSAGRFSEALAAEHDITVRAFSEDGLACLLLDSQTERRMTIHDLRTGRSPVTQSLEDAIYVYRMVYDTRDRRWKIGRFVQQIKPRTSPSPQGLPRVVNDSFFSHSAFTSRIGRDH